MNIKLELLRNHISDYINCKIEDFEIDASQIADSTAIEILSEIQKVIKDENYSDFNAIEEIVCIFEKYNIDIGYRHDFWNNICYGYQTDDFNKDIGGDAIKFYENLSGVAALPSVINPFIDCNDLEMLKAYNLWISVGVAANLFDPDGLLNREQALLIAVRMVEKLR